MPDEGAAEGPQMLINPLGIESMPKSAGWPEKNSLGIQIT